MPELKVSLSDSSLDELMDQDGEDIGVFDLSHLKNVEQDGVAKIAKF